MQRNAALQRAGNFIKDDSLDRCCRRICTSPTNIVHSDV